MKSPKLNLILAVTVLAAFCAFAAANPQTLTGEVSDSMCGAKHMMAGNAACTRACVQKGSNYALVVGEKLYTLHTEDKAVAEELDKLAGEKAKITGVVNDDTIEVSKVAATK